MGIEKGMRLHPPQPAPIRMPPASAAPDQSLSASGDRNLPPILTLKEVAQILRCSKAHVANVINGHVKGLPRLTYVALGRRKLVRREWLDQWMEANKVQC
jgi:excisionase family DNA binding protein